MHTCGYVSLGGGVELTRPSNSGLVKWIPSIYVTSSRHGRVYARSSSPQEEERCWTPFSPTFYSSGWVNTMAGRKKKGWLCMLAWRSASLVPRNKDLFSGGSKLLSNPWTTPPPPPPPRHTPRLSRWGDCCFHFLFTLFRALECTVFASIIFSPLFVATTLVICINQKYTLGRPSPMNFILLTHIKHGRPRDDSNTCAIIRADIGLKCLHQPPGI